jgi:hypothetical protein
LNLGILDIGADQMLVSDLPKHFQQVNVNMADHIVKSLNPDNDYYICFDQLDLGFSPTDESYAHRLVGLILAARDLNLRARNDDGKRLSVVVFLRNDIWQDLHFEDKNKITENYLSLVEWNRDGAGLTLKKLMERRFGEVLAGGGEVSWDDVFDETKEMAGRQTKYAHIVDRTLPGTPASSPLRLPRHGNGAHRRADRPVEDRRARPAIPRSMSSRDTCVAPRYSNGPTTGWRSTGAEAFELEGMDPCYIDIDGFWLTDADTKGPESAPIAN